MPLECRLSQAMPAERSYLSVVATARNDDHGANLLRRIQIFVNDMAELRAGPGGPARTRGSALHECRLPPLRKPRYPC
jgi:hypothetical protein